MTVSLKDRFLNCALSPLNFFLKLTGVYLNLSDLTWRNLLVRFWGIFLLIICTQSNIYITVKRTTLFTDFFSLLPHVKDFDHELTNALFRLTALVSDTLVHVALVFNIWPRIEYFLDFLETVDYELKRPNLCHVNRISQIGLLYTLGMVSLHTLTIKLKIYNEVPIVFYLHIILFLKTQYQMVLNLYFGIRWEYCRHPTRKFQWLDATQNMMRMFANQWFTVIPILIFALSGELLVTYFESISANLKLLIAYNAKSQSPPVANKTSVLLQPLKPLFLAISLLHRHLNAVLMINCFLAFISMLTCSYYSIEHIREGRVIAACWDVTDIVDSFARYWAMCHISDRMREAVSEIS